jgi:hypothetical protein
VQPLHIHLTGGEQSNAVRLRIPSKAAGGGRSMQVVSFWSASAVGSQEKKDGSVVET